MGFQVASCTGVKYFNDIMSGRTSSVRTSRRRFASSSAEFSTTSGAKVDEPFFDRDYEEIQYVIRVWDKLLPLLENGLNPTDVENWHTWRKIHEADNLLGVAYYFIVLGFPGNGVNPEAGEAIFHEVESVLKPRGELRALIKRDRVQGVDLKDIKKMCKLSNLMSDNFRRYNRWKQAQN
jgi:hypothetical protein